MLYTQIPKILDQEGTDFYRIENRWQPKDLIPGPYRQDMLKDVQGKLNQLSAAEDELQLLDRAPLFVGILKNLRVVVRQAQFSWRVDDLKFLQAISEFYSNYGIVLKHLKYEQARGRFDQDEL